MRDLHYDLIWIAECAAWILAVAFALWRGDGPTRLIAVIYLAGNLAIMGVFPNRPAELAVDVAGLLAMCAVAVRSPRPWLLWACAFQLVSAATRAAAMLDGGIDMLAYSTALNTWWMLQVAALVWGVIEVVRRPAPAVRAEPA